MARQPKIPSRVSDGEGAAAVWVARSELHAWADNPRKNDGEPVKRVMESIKRFGFASPIIARTNGEVIAGHTRLKAAEALGLDRVPVRYMDLDPAEAHLLALADNKLNEEAEWDAAAVASILSDYSLDDAALAGWDSDDLEKLADELGANEPKEIVEDEVPEPPVEPTTKPGDLWILGEHRLLCGDSTKAEDVERLMAGAKADLWLTDPPYGVAYKSHGRRGKANQHADIENDSMPLDEMASFWQSAAEAAYRSCTDAASYYWFACQGGDQMMMMMMSIARAKWRVRHELIWVKDQMVFGRCDYHYKHEPILYGWKEDGTHQWNADRKQTSVLEYPRPKKSDEHPTMKPVELVAYLAANNTRKGQAIIDTFLGSGTTLIAAEQLGRRCYGMEISPQYCDVIVKRWETLTGKKAELESNRV